VQVTITLDGMLKDWAHGKTKPDGSFEGLTVSQIAMTIPGIKFGETGRAGSGRNYPYPDDFDGVQTLKPTYDNALTTIIPITPTEFVRSRTVGWGVAI